MKPKISVVMIVKNEEAVLARCLDSVKDADEIIIVDTGSIDGTIEIAKKYTPHVSADFTWCDDFSKARNHARVKATGDWILSIDADEYCHDFSKVREAVDLAEARGALAVDVTMISEDKDEQGRAQSFGFPRLFKRSDQVWWVGAVHNHLSVIGDVLGDVKITFGYSPAHRLDPDRSFRILEKEVKERPDAVREMFYLGREYYYRFDYEKCVVVMGKYVQKSSYLAEKADAFLIMAKCYWYMKMGEDARDACLQCLKINPNFKEAVLFMASIVWPKHSKQWERMAETADNSEVLFVR